MPSEPLDASAFSPDTLDFLQALYHAEVQYLIVGGEAVIYHGYARVTGDIDFFYAADDLNAQRLFAALHAFWKGPPPGVAAPAELQEPGVIVQFGVPPRRIDLINRISGVTFDDAWPERVRVEVRTPAGTIPVWYLGLDALIRNKRASGRPKDLVDVDFLASEDGTP